MLCCWKKNTEKKTLTKPLLAESKLVNSSLAATCLKANTDLDLSPKFTSKPAFSTSLPISDHSHCDLHLK